ncbi:hypothetical protein SDC9_129955 [bioreactor metagenome]|uniref:Uncharacterized protein n=1 Tax=bioreactor metagenome TaxID=1076179 RepID=A0A645D1D0_9ZZZZ
MVGAAEKLARAAAAIGRHLHSLVRAAVVQHLDALVGVAHHDHWLVSHGGREIVPRLGHLAGVADVDPGVGEQLLHLQRKDLGMDVAVLVHFGVAHQGADGCRVVAVFGHSASLSPA